MFRPYLRTVHEINDTIAAAVALFSNVLLIFLIIKHTPKALEPYSRILLQTCAIDLIYTALIFVLKPHTEFTDGIFLLMINGFLEKVTSPWDFILNLTWCYALFFCMFAMPIPFYYRYVCVCRYNLTVLSIANHEI
uniref:Uncharacterized protein n=1 Tax=Acrobeloides nanus TaxID=290746 RepID=A0A914EAJ5_9BILA